MRVWGVSEKRLGVVSCTDRHRFASRIAFSDTELLENNNPEDLLSAGTVAAPLDPDASPAITLDGTHISALDELTDV